MSKRDATVASPMVASDEESYADEAFSPVVVLPPDETAGVDLELLATVKDQVARGFVRVGEEFKRPMNSATFAALMRLMSTEWDMSNVESFSIQHTPSAALPETLPTMAQCETVYLDDNCNARVLCNNFARVFPNVTKVCLNNNGLSTPAELAPLAGCANLRTVDLSENVFADPIEAIGALPSTVTKVQLMLQKTVMRCDVANVDTLPEQLESLDLGYNLDSHPTPRLLQHLAHAADKSLTYLSVDGYGDLSLWPLKLGKLERHPTESHYTVE